MMKMQFCLHFSYYVSNTLSNYLTQKSLMMMKTFLLLAISLNCLLGQLAIANYNMPMEGDSNKKSSILYHQINFEKPIASIENIKYQNGEQVEWELSNDRRQVKIKNYQYPEKIIISVTFQNGTTEHYFKGSCFINPLLTL